MGHKETIYQGILDGNRSAVVGATNEALAAKMPAGEVLNEAMIPAMAEVGRLFETNEYYVPEMLIAARAMKAGLAILKPELVGRGHRAQGQGRGRHRQGRPARHRQEPGGHHGRGRRL